MNLYDGTWIEYAASLNERALWYLKERGFENHDLLALARAEPLETTPSEDWVGETPTLQHLALAHALDPRPRAEIVSMAWVALYSEMTRIAFEADDIDNAFRYAYTLGQVHMQAQVFVLEPGQSASYAEKISNFSKLFAITNKYSQIELEGRYLRAKGLQKKREKEKPHLERRNAALCETGRQLQASGSKDIHLARDVWLEWVRSNRWEEYAPAKALKDPKQVRHILREGGVLPPKKSQKL